MNSSILELMSTNKEAITSVAPSPINVRIASRVRGLRTEQALTLDALAARCGVSRAMLSLIERGESSPTAVVLERVATGLGIALAALFDDPAAPASPVARREDRASWQDPESRYIRRNISPEAYPSPIKIVEVILPAKMAIAYASGSWDTPRAQQIWVLEGGIDVTVGHVAYRLRRDDCLAMTLNAPISFHNRSQKRARYVVVIGNERARPALATTPSLAVQEPQSIGTCRDARPRR
jgi:transcriptional regulator with XRE-family HTH domain